jgi:hypothetical protein
VVGYVLLGLGYGFVYRLAFGSRRHFGEWHVMAYLLMLVPLCWMENTLSDGYLPRLRNAAILMAVTWILVRAVGLFRNMASHVTQRESSSRERHQTGLGVQVASDSGPTPRGSTTWQD